MPSVRLLDTFSTRVLENEGVGGEPHQVSIVAPSLVTPDDVFDVKVMVLDWRGLPVRLDGLLQMGLDDEHHGVVDINFTVEELAIVEVTGLSIATVGFHRFDVVFRDERFVSNPILCTSEAEDRIYWGDPHIHTVLGNCHPDTTRSINFGYTAARHLSGLDWASMADHVSNGRCEFAKWKDQSATCDQFDDPPDFVTLPAYEASFPGGAGGDNNVYFTDPPEMYIDDFAEGTIKTLVHKLSAALDPLGIEFFVVPHHTTRTGKHGEIADDIYPGVKAMPVLEVHSKWGSSEYRGNPNALKEVHDGPSYAVDQLNRGLQFGFVAGTDTHASLTFCDPSLEPSHIDRLPGLTAVLAPDLSRSGVFTAIANRCCYAASGERIVLQVRMTPEAQAEKERTVEVLAAGQSDVEKIEVICSGVVVHTEPIDHWHGQVTWTDVRALPSVQQTESGQVYYYVRVSCASGAQAWSSPVWYRSGEE